MLRKFINKKILLPCIVAIAFILRFYLLSSVPPSLDWDEVAYGYNAYSILQTGKDEHGVKFPVVLKSFGDYKPALYSYLAIPSISVFGLTPFAVRFPNAVFSLIGVIGTYFLAKKIFNNEKIALLATFFMAVSPWQIQFTRFSHEATVAVALNILAIYFFLSAFKKNWQILLSALFLGFTFYSYQSDKIFIPLISLVAFGVFYKQWIKIPKKFLFSAGFIFLLILLPLVLYIKSDSNALNRAKGTSIFSHQTEILQQSANQLIADKQSNNLIGIVMNNRRVVYGTEIVKNYLSHFSPEWLFVKGDQPRHHPPGMGILYLWELPFILLGVFYLIKGKFDRKYKILIFSWILIAPIPAMITYDVPHAGRTMNSLPIFQIFTSLGVIYLFGILRSTKKRWVMKSVIFIMVFTFLINFCYYLNQYFNVMNKKYSAEWQYGWKEAVYFLDFEKDKYNKIIVSDVSPLDQSYMFFLFYSKYSPSLYQMSGSSKGFDKFEFRRIDWQKDSKLSNVLIVGSRKEISGPTKILKEVDYLNNKPAIIIISTDK